MSTTSATVFTHSGIEDYVDQLGRQARVASKILATATTDQKN